MVSVAFLSATLSCTDINLDLHLSGLAKGQGNCPCQAGLLRGSTVPRQTTISLGPRQAERGVLSSNISAVMLACLCGLLLAFLSILKPSLLQVRQGGLTSPPASR